MSSWMRPATTSTVSRFTVARAVVAPAPFVALRSCIACAMSHGLLDGVMRHDPQSRVAGRDDQPDLLAPGRQDVGHALRVVDPNRRREAEVVCQRVDDVEPDVEPSAVVERRVRDALISRLAALLDAAVDERPQ